MLYGEHEHNLDEKGRITVPSSFRDLLTAVFVTRGPEGCLLVFELAAWLELSRKLKKKSISQHVARVLFSGTQAQPDSHGRILIPAGLRAYAGLVPGEPVIVLGVGDRLEIWNRDRWLELNSTLLESGELAAGLAELEL
jgi:MraZ protein